MTKRKVIVTESTVKNDDGDERQTKQYRITIPKQLAEAMRLDGATLDWSVESADSLKVTVVDRGDDE